MAERNILFDLDGTLAHSFPNLVYCYDYAAQAFCGRRVSEESLMVIAGSTHDDTLRHFAGGPDVCDEAALEVLKGHYRVAFRQNAIPIPLFPGVVEMLEELKYEGFGMGLVTSRGRESTDQILHDEGIASFFKATVAIEDVKGRAKPDPYGVILAAEGLGLSQQQINQMTVTVVGDTPFDIWAGRRAGARTLGCTYGHFGKNLELFEPKAHRYADSVEKVRKIILETRL